MVLQCDSCMDTPEQKAMEKGGKILCNCLLLDILFIGSQEKTENTNQALAQ